jgi:deoxyribonuclease V
MTGTVRYIAGVDAAVRDNVLLCCIGVFSFPSLQIIEDAYATVSRSIPYVPGFLSFRELPVIVKTYKKLKRKPDLMLIDGQGIAHPRSLGLASHVGVVLKIPTIGCAKSHLFGDYTMPRTRKGSYTVVRDGRRKIGLVLRTRDDVKPLFVSPGNRVDFDDCRSYVLASVIKYRIPEPLRYAHTMAGARARQQ